VDDVVAQVAKGAKCPFKAQLCFPRSLRRLGQSAGFALALVWLLGFRHKLQPRGLGIEYGSLYLRSLPEVKDDVPAFY